LLLLRPCSQRPVPQSLHWLLWRPCWQDPLGLGLEGPLGSGLGLLGCSIRGPHGRAKKGHCSFSKKDTVVISSMGKKTKQKSKWAKPRAASRAQMKKRDAIERDRTGPVVFHALCWGRARKIDSNHLELLSFFLSATRGSPTTSVSTNSSLQKLARTCEPTHGGKTTRG
jgi:hypothetical protein